MSAPFRRARWPMRSTPQPASPPPASTPPRAGVAGPPTLGGRLRYARICGLTAPPQALARHTGLARHLFGMVAPDAVLRPLAEASGELGDVAPHIFSFGRLATAARWAAA